MANSFNSDSFTTTSFTAETIVVVAVTGSGGRFTRRVRRLIFPESRFIKEEEFSKRLIAKPFKILTFTKDINAVPILTQYKRFDYHLKGYPRKDTEQEFVLFRANPIREKFVKIADIKARPSNIIEEVLHLQTLKANPIILTNFSKELKAKTLHGINLIRKAIEMEELSFSFNEAPKEWVGSKIYTDAAKFLQFDQPSSFVGNVIYEKATEELTIVLGDSIYNFCSVPRIIYDGFRKASSKGKYFNSFIKELWDC